MIRICGAFLFLLFFTAKLTFSQSSVDYSRTNKYNGLKLSTEDLKKIVASIEYYYKQTAVDSNASKYRGPFLSCDLKRKDKALKISTFKQLKNLELDKEWYTDINLSYSWDGADIGSVSLRLADYDRTLSVSGTDQKRVDALFHDLDEQLSANQTFLGWIDWGMVFLIASIIIFSLNAVMVEALLTTDFFENISSKAKILL